MEPNCIFLDNNSSTEIDPRVLNKYIEALKLSTGNSSSKHYYGYRSQALLEIAKEEIAKIFGTTPECVVFTSGATESNNLAILGLKDKTHYLSSKIEHSSVIEPLEYLTGNHEVTYLGLDSEGYTIKNQEIINKAKFVSIHHANNEIGVVEEFNDFIKPQQSILHTDSTQSIGKIHISFNSHPIDIISLSGHKIHGPKGIGALIFRTKEIKNQLGPILFGGHHSEDLRPGTIAVALGVALSEAIKIATEELPETSKKLSKMSETFYDLLKKEILDIQLVGPKDFSKRLPGLLSISFPGINSSELISKLSSKIAFSAGSACRASKSRVAKEVLNDDNLVNGFCRFGISKFNTEEEIERAAKVIIFTAKSLSINSR